METAAESYQIESNTQSIDGCAESVWDMCSRKKVLCSVEIDHCNRYKENVAIMSDMLLQAYRLSIMWSNHTT